MIHQDRLPDLQRMAAAGGSSPAAVPTAGELLDRLEAVYQAQEAVQRNASPRIALAALLCG